MSKPKRNPFGLPQAMNPEWFRFEPVATADDGTTSADVYVYDAIDPWFGLDPQEFVQAVDSLDVDQVNLYVNSPGGSVYGAQAMTAALQRSPAKVTAYVDGLAASAASFLITAADEVVMAPGAELMIHDALAITYGNASEHEKSVTQLNRLSDTIASMYAGKAGGEASDWRSIMQGEQWYSAQEAVDAGLADRIAGDEEDETDVENRFDLSIFAYAGRSHAPNPAMPNRERKSSFASRVIATLTGSPKPSKRPAEPDATTDKEVGRMTDIKKVTDRLGLSAEATEVDQPIADSQTSHDAQDRDRRSALVNTWIKSGIIPASRYAHYLDLVEKDEEGMIALFTPTPPSTVAMNRKQNGVDESTDDAVRADAVYNHFFPKVPPKSTYSDADETLYNKFYGKPTREPLSPTDQALWDSMTKPKQHTFTAEEERLYAKLTGRGDKPRLSVNDEAIYRKFYPEQ